MRILYVTDVFHGFKEAIFDGAEEMNGLPSFNRVLKKLVDENNEIDFILIQNADSAQELNIGVSWLNEGQFKNTIKFENSILSKLSAAVKLIFNTTKLLIKGDYDFVYGHGTVAGLAAISAKLLSVPFGQRVYGTFLWDEYKKDKSTFSKLKMIRRFYELITYKFEKAFLLITNDGSRGDLVYDKLCNNKCKYDFYYWVNGVDRVESNSNVNHEEGMTKKYNIQKPFLFYPARIDSWKRQDRAINIVKKLRDDGIYIHCYFAGGVSVQSYYEKLRKQIIEGEVNELVHFLGNVDKETMVFMNKHAVATLSLYDVCCFTNIFHEMMASGAVPIIKRDGVVDEIISDGSNGFLVSDNDLDVVNIIKKLLECDNNHQIRSNAIMKSIEYTKSWDDRINDEIGLVKRYSKVKR